jgi:transcriptional regulator with XRE-family HTH domain
MGAHAAGDERRQAAAERLESIGKRVRQLRRAQNLTQEALAARVGVDRRVLGYVESGQRDFGVSLLWPLAAGLEVSVRDLLPD